MNKKISNKLLLARESLGISQGQMSIESGITKSDISRYESGNKKFLQVELLQYLQHKGFDLDSLFDDEREHILRRTDQDFEQMSAEVDSTIDMSEIEKSLESLDEIQKVEVLLVYLKDARTTIESLHLNRLKAIEANHSKLRNYVYSALAVLQRRVEKFNLEEVKKEQLKHGIDGVGETVEEA